MDNIYLDKIVYTFYKDGNTLGSTSYEEKLKIIVEAPIGSIDKEGGFIVIKTDGWSDDNDGRGLKDIISLVEKGVESRK